MAGGRKRCSQGDPRPCRGQHRFIRARGIRFRAVAFHGCCGWSQVCRRRRFADEWVGNRAESGAPRHLLRCRRREGRALSVGCAAPSTGAENRGWPGDSGHDGHDTVGRHVVPRRPGRGDPQYCPTGGRRHRLRERLGHLALDAAVSRFHLYGPVSIAPRRRSHETQARQII